VSIRRSAVIGAGTMGSGIAQIAAMAAIDVTLLDASDGVVE
jgi:3-hydroxyacyl-CoA dehydrogenase